MKLPKTLSESSGSEAVSLDPRFSALVDTFLMMGLTAALLVPCFWQARIQAGDLSSHVYNAWLASQIKSGSVHGVTVVATWTNVLSDWLLEFLLHHFGAAQAESVVAGAAVLVFFWGAFRLVEVVSGRRPWMLCPILAMLSYGLVFHLGFLNYYLSAGLCLWILALLWRPTRTRFFIAVPLAILAVLAHVLPVVWAFSVLAYLQIARRVEPKRRSLVLLGGFAALIVIRTVLMRAFLYRWSPDQFASLNGIAGLIGVEQVWLFGSKYLIVAAGLFLLWSLLFLERLDQRSLLADPVAQIWLLHIAAFALLPAAIQFPQYQHVLAYIPQRISLLGAVFLCVMVGGARYGHGVTRLSALVATIFFTFLYLDDRAFNLAENEVTNLVEQVPSGARVVAAITDSNAWINALGHVVDRACIGRCFSYGNYEPATAQFRLRVFGPNHVVASSMAVVKEIEEGRHIVTADEAPLYSVCLCDTPEHRFCLRALEAGDRTCSFSLPVSPRFWIGMHEPPGANLNLAREDQRQIPDYQARVPIVDRAQHLETASPHAISSQQNGKHF